MEAVKDYLTARPGKESPKPEITPEEAGKLKSFAALLNIKEGQAYLRYLDTRIAVLRGLPRIVETWRDIETKIELLMELREELATAEDKLNEGD